VTEPHGVLIVDKPSGKTSHDIVAEARRLFATRAVGHAGTLDPMATGVLLLMLGEATKLSPFLTADDKRYRAVITLGRSTDTLDAEGATVEERDVAPLDAGGLERALDAERARTEQVPPAFSAIKVDGERAHRLSRQGRPPELPPRPVAVSDLQLEARDERSITLTLTVSKGYFVRSLARDVCAALGVPGHLSALRRLKSGAFGIEEACSWPPAAPSLLPVAEAAIRCLAPLRLRPESVLRARQGKQLTPDDFEQAGSGDAPQAWLAPDGTLVAIGRLEGDVYRVSRGFAPTAP
jgi:tRNA pseudouridine55 synthase